MDERRSLINKINKFNDLKSKRDYEEEEKTGKTSRNHPGGFQPICPASRQDSALFKESLRPDQSEKEANSLRIGDGGDQ